MIQQYFCPECLDIKEFEDVYIDENFNVKDEEIMINSHYLECMNCNERILDPKNEDENFIQAYTLFRERKNLLLPEEIIKLREKYDLSQRQLAKILGWSHVTLSRYESGALQSTSHNNELVLIDDPKNMLRILNMNKENLSESEYKRINEKITNIINEKSGLNLFKMIEKNFENNPSEYNGYKEFDKDNLLKIIKYFVSKDDKVFKVKLFKYLWYTDFLSFKNYTMSLTGLKYSKLSMGPVPEDYDLLVSLVLSEGNDIRKELVDFGYSNPGERFYTDEEIDLSNYTEEELEVLERVYEVVSPHNSSSISEFSHKEIGWIQTKDKEFISYKFAQELSVD